jgi:hypothetical protein
MAPVAGFAGLGWLLPIGAAMMAGPNRPIGSGDALHDRSPSTFSVADNVIDAALMSTSDRLRIARGQTATLLRDWGPFALAFSASRTRIHREAAGRIVRRNALATYQISAETRADLPEGLTLGWRGALTYVSRRFGPLGLDARPRRSFIAGTDLSIMRGGVDRLSLGYVEIATAAQRRPIARMAELVGGAPHAGHGLRVAFSHRFATDRPGSLVLGIDASALRLSVQDSLLLGAPSPTIERRMALSLDRRF